MRNQLLWEAILEASRADDKKALKEKVTSSLVEEMQKAAPEGELSELKSSEVKPLTTSDIKSTMRSASTIIEAQLDRIRDLLPDTVDDSESQSIVELRKSIGDLVAEFTVKAVEVLDLLLPLLTRHLHRNQPQYIDTWIGYHGCVVESMYLKAAVIKLNTLLETYSPDTQLALRKLKLRMIDRNSELEQQIKHLTASLAQYQGVGSEFESLVSSYMDIINAKDRVQRHLQRLRA